MRATLSHENIVAIVLLSCGTLLTLLTGMWVLQMGRLAEDGVVATVIAVHHDDDGDSYGVYEVGARRMHCVGHFEVGQALAYDPEAPGVCRAQAHLAWGTPLERFAMIGGLLMILAGVGLFIYERWFHRDREVLDELAAIDRALRELDEG